MRQGHSGIEVHSHFLGNVEPHTFVTEVNRAKGMHAPDPHGDTPARRIGDISDHEPTLREISKLQKEFGHTRGEDGQITTRGRAGDAIDVVQKAQAKIDEHKAKLDEHRRNGTLTEEIRLDLEAKIKKEAESAVNKALRASDQTDFNSSYEVRDELIKSSFGARDRDNLLQRHGVQDPAHAKMTDPAVERAYREHFEGRPEVQKNIDKAIAAQKRIDAHEAEIARLRNEPQSEHRDQLIKDQEKAIKKQLKDRDLVRDQMAYDHLAKETILRLAQDNITYTEQSNSHAKMDTLR